MKEKNIISGKQFMFTIACFIQSSALLSAFIAAITLQESWIPSIISIILCIPFFILYSKLSKLFPNKTYVQIIEIILGPFFGKILNIFYIAFFFVLTSLNIRDLSNLTKITTLNKTPDLVIILICVSVCSITITYGLKTITQLGKLFTITSIAVTIISILLLIEEFCLPNLLPVFSLKFINYVQATHIAMTIPFGELIVFLMITPNVKMKENKLTKYFISGFLIGGFTFLFSILRDIAVLGNTFSVFTTPSLITFRLIHVGEVLSRMEILFAIILIMLLFFKINFLYYITMITIKDSFKLKSFKKLIKIVGATLIIASITIQTDPLTHMHTARTVEPFIWVLFEFAFPTIIFLIAIIFNKKIKKGMDVCLS